MTKAQEATIERMRKEAERCFSYGRPESYEIKYFTVKEYPEFVSLVIVSGRKGDEGTMAELVCRDRVHLFIGKRGGVTYPYFDMKKEKQFTRALHGSSLLKVSIEQSETF